MPICVLDRNLHAVAQPARSHEGSRHKGHRPGYCHVEHMLHYCLAYVAKFTVRMRKYQRAAELHGVFEWNLRLARGLDRSAWQNLEYV